MLYLLSLLILFFVWLPAYSQLSADFCWVEKNTARQSPNCSIAFKYPQFTVTIDKATTAKIAFINKKILGLANGETNKFQLEFAALAANGKGWTEGELTDEYEIYSRHNHLISLSFYIEKYIKPSAHPSHLTLTFNYDTQTAKNLDLKSIFKKDSDYLNILSKLCYDNLVSTVQNPNKESIKEGTKPIASTFKKFYLTSDSLNIVFDECAVDCYAGGRIPCQFRMAQSNLLLIPKVQSIPMLQCSRYFESLEHMALFLTICIANSLVPKQSLVLCVYIQTLLHFV